jgi:hypothetical protein
MDEPVQKADDTELTEIVEAHIPRVDGVKGAANGFPFLIVKSAAEQPDATALTAAAAGDTVTEPTAIEATPATPVVKADGDASTPGSPAWERIDADRLNEITAHIVAARKLLQEAIDSENRELWEGDEDDGDWTTYMALCDAIYAIECGLANVAMSAAIETGEAGEVAKSKPLTHRAAEVVRKGITSLQGLLDSRSASKEPPMPDETAVTKATTEAAAETPAAVTDPEAQPTAETAVPAAEAAEEKVEKAAVATTTEPPAPAPSLTDVMKSAEFADVLKSVFTPALEAAVKPLEERIAKMEQQPVPTGVFLRGRGDENGKDVAEIIKARDAAADPIEKALKGQQAALALIEGNYQR